jgi:hypothetical protein
MFPAFYPGTMSPHFQQYSTSENMHPSKMATASEPEQGTKYGGREVEPPAPLGLVPNVRSNCPTAETPMPKFWKSAITSTHQCYSGPVCSAR